VPRISLITQKADLPPDRHAELDAIVEVLHGVRGPFAILLRSPGLAQKVMEAGAHVRLKSSLTPVERELAIIAVAREQGRGVRVGRARDHRAECRPA
jgi:4-carboxymuconolactone decarboxylase